MHQFEHDSRPLSIVILYSAGHLGSAIILNELNKSPTFNIKGVVKAKPLSFSTTGIRKLKRHLKNVGWRFGWLLFWQRLIQSSAFVLSLTLIGSKKRILPAWRIARKYNIPVHMAGNINDEETQAFIKSTKPDLIISAYFSQILKADVIHIPKLGVLNVHPGWLPAYKGAMAYFWVLKQQEDYAGVTLHWIDEGIDTGEIIARHKITLKRGATQQIVLEETAKAGAALLETAGQTLLAGGVLETIMPTKSEADEYYPMPGHAHFREYFKTRRFFKIRDVFKAVRGRKT